MRKFFIFSLVTLALLAGSVCVVSVAHAQVPVDYSNLNNLTNSSYNTVMIYIMNLFAWLLGVAAIILQNAVYYTVVTMGNYVNHLSAVGVAWRILRDMGNIVLIFGFLAAGIATILNLDFYGWKTKMIPMLLISAVFLNFSLFISEAAIDTGNLFATQFYTQINGGVPAQPNNFDNLIAAIHNEGISNKIMGQLGLQKIYGNAITNTKIFEGGSPWIIGFMGILLFLVAAFVMFSLAFILIARFVALIFLIIIAPIGFAGFAVPKLSGLAKKWGSALLEQTITAPILLLLLYIALAVITDAQFLTGFGSSSNADWTGFTSGNITGFAGMLLSFLVAMGLLLTVVVFSKRLSAFGADWATRMGGRLSFGAVSLAGRATLGGTGNLLTSKRMQSWARNAPYGSKYALRAGVLAGRGLRSATYDVRNAPGTGKALGALGIDAGKGATLTAKQAHEAQYGYKPVKEWFRQSAEEREQAGREIDFKKAQSEIEALGAGPFTPAQQAKLDAANSVITSALSKMSTKQLEELSGIKKGTDALVNNLSPQQFEALMKSDKLSDGEKVKIKEVRYRVLSAAVGSGNAPDIKKAINALSRGELEAIPTQILTNQLVLDQLSDKQRDTITDSKERTATEKDLIRKSSPVGKVEDVFRSNPITGPINASNLINNLSSAQIAKLPRNILTTGIVAVKFKPADLIAIQEEKKLTSAEMTIIGNAIRASATASQKTKDYVTNSLAAPLWS